MAHSVFHDWALYLVAPLTLHLPASISRPALLVLSVLPLHSGLCMSDLERLLRDGGSKKVRGRTGGSRRLLEQ
jgi:hypothetical protein